MRNASICFPFLAALGLAVSATAAAQPAVDPLGYNESLQFGRQRKEEQRREMEQSRRQHLERAQEAEAREAEALRETQQRLDLDVQARRHAAQEQRLARQEQHLAVQQRQIAKQRQKLATQHERERLQLRHLLQLSAEDERLAQRQQASAAARQRASGRQHLERESPSAAAAAPYERTRSAASRTEIAR